MVIERDPLVARRDRRARSLAIYIRSAEDRHAERGGDMGRVLSVLLIAGCVRRLVLGVALALAAPYRWKNGSRRICWFCSGMEARRSRVRLVLVAVVGGAAVVVPAALPGAGGLFT